MINKYLRKGSAFSGITETQVKTALRSHLKIRMTIIKKNASNYVGKEETLPTACGDIN